MDFSLVKRLFIPQGEVTKITNLEGITLWQKISRVLKEWRGLSPLTCTPTVAGEFEEVKMYGQSKQQLLPDGYTQLEYIQNDTNSYIKTGVNDGTDDMSYEADFTYVSGSGYQYVLGAYGGDNVKNTVLYINNSNQIGGWINKPYSANIMISDIVIPNQRIKCYTDSTKFIVNGITQTDFKTDDPQRTGAELYLFRRNGDGSSYAPQTTSNAIIRLHSLVIKNKNVEVRNYIPAKRNSDNVLGLYDLVTNTFFTNAGTGEFVAGDVAPTPTAPIEIESVGDKSKNLFDLNKVTWGYNIDVNGNFNTSTLNSCSDYIPCKPNTTYTVSFTVNWLTTTTRYHCFDANKQWIEQVTSTTVVGSELGDTKKLTFTTSANANYIAFTFKGVSTDDETLSTNIQLEEGDTATPYEPYGYKVPVMVGGKNLFNFTTFRTQTVGGVTYTNNNDGSISCYGNANSGNAITIATLKAGTYTFNLNQTKISNQVDVMFSFVGIGDMYDTDKLYNSFTYIFTSDTTINIKRSTNGFIDKDIKIQIEEGTQATSYQPYVTPTTTNIYLNEPLRKISEYADTLSVDGTDVTVVRNVNVKDLKTLTWKYSSSQRMYATDTGTGTVVSGTPCMCNILKGVGAVTVTTSLKSDKSICLGSTEASKNQMYAYDTNYTNADDFTNMINSQDNALLYYPLTTPTTETYTIENPIMAFDNTSIITVDTTVPPSEVYASEYVEE